MHDEQNQSLIEPNVGLSDGKSEEELRQLTPVRQSTNRLVLNNLTKTTFPLVIVGFLGAGENFIRVKILSYQQNALAVDALNGMTFGLLLSSDSGFLNPASAMIAQAFGEGNKAEIRDIVQQGWLLGAALSVPTIVVMWFSEPMLNLFGQSPELTQIVGPYARLVSFASPGIFGMYVDNTFLRATGKAHALVPLYLIYGILGAGISFLLVDGNLGFPKLGILGSGYATVAQVWGCWIGLKLYFLTKDFEEYHLFDFRNIRRNNLTALKKMLKYGSPMSGLALAEQIKFFISGMMMGWLGSKELAINQATNAYLPFFNSPILGIRQASQIFVSQFNGKKDYRNMRRFGNLGIYLELGINSIPLIAYTVAPLQLARVFIPEDEVADMETFIRLVFVTKAITRILESIQGPVVENLKGLLDTYFSSLVQLLSSLAVTLPLSYLFGFVFDWDLYGINSAAAVSVGLTIPVLLRRWIKLSNPTAEIPMIEEPELDQTTSDGVGTVLMVSSPERSAPEQHYSCSINPLFDEHRRRNSGQTIEVVNAVSDISSLTSPSSDRDSFFIPKDKEEASQNIIGDSGDSGDSQWVNVQVHPLEQLSKRIERSPTQ